MNKLSDNKKYYYLKLKDNFFDNEKMIVLESMPDGYIYSNILLKLYLRSLKGEGRLMFNDRIPYNPTLLAQITRHSVGDVERAINIFEEFELIEKMDNGAIYMLDIQNFIGHSSTEADRQREYQRKLKESNGNDLKMIECKKSNKKSNEVSNKKSTPEKEKEKEREKELDLYRQIQHLPFSNSDNRTLLSEGWNQYQIDTVLDKMENYGKLKTYKSAILTARNWLKKDYPIIKEVLDQNPFLNR